MDIVDRSDIEIDNYIKGTIRNNLSKGPRNGGLTPQGFCYNCEKDIPKPKLFCNGDCAKQHDIANRRGR